MGAGDVLRECRRTVRNSCATSTVAVVNKHWLHLCVQFNSRCWYKTLSSRVIRQVHQRVSSDRDASTSRDKSLERLSWVGVSSRDLVGTVDIVLQSGDAWHVRLGADGGTLQ